MVNTAQLWGGGRGDMVHKTDLISFPVEFSIQQGRRHQISNHYKMH